MDIGPGDRVRCVDDSPCALTGNAVLQLGRIYTIEKVEWIPLNLGRGPGAGVQLTAPETQVYPLRFWDISRFRKLPDISEWLETSTDYEEPRRVPAPREVEGV